MTDPHPLHGLAQLAFGVVAMFALVDCYYMAMLWKYGERRPELTGVVARVCLHFVSIFFSGMLMWALTMGGAMTEPKQQGEGETVFDIARTDLPSCPMCRQQSDVREADGCFECFCPFCDLSGSRQLSPRVAVGMFGALIYDPDKYEVPEYVHD